ncbi:AraC family transcriptional regulator [Paenibacillus sp. PCH8]|uniref:helix-turn-helix domain-containing protein n=1 Tax=Paenibacillus sp. PCH8 TaxID=2066524 RepID=UPI000CF86BAD|nr:AraC family transcriptional regulator [Paenibacillus sp. PCH8]PQP82727.1 AraC family transcriptional regulator [Paenibacillus sp. PCH8]
MLEFHIPQPAPAPFILHESSSQFDWKGSGSLSLKTFRNGRSLYEAGRGHFAVNHERYLLLNEGQEYSLHIDSSVPVESFCIFFPAGYVEEISRNLVSSDLRLLDEPYACSSSSRMEWVERTYSMDNRLGAALNRLRNLYSPDTMDSWATEEQLQQVAVHMLDLHRDVQQEINELNMIKHSTREELYRRVYIGHEYISAYYDQPLSLEQTAAAAQLSVNHFLRNYKQLFGTSPHRYLTECRLQAAKRLLLDTDTSVTHICYDVGFESLGSFSSLFTRRFDTSPTQLRAKR